MSAASVPFTRPIMNHPARMLHNKEVSWIGTVQALWLDDFGFLREDNGNAVLDGYYTDPVIQQFYDEAENKTRIRRFVSTKDDEFAPFLMQGTVTAYDAATGTVHLMSMKLAAAGSGPYSAWTVYNLTDKKTGSSTTSSAIIAAVPGTEPLSCHRQHAWFAVGDTIMVSSF